MDAEPFRHQGKKKTIGGDHRRRRRNSFFLIYNLQSTINNGQEKEKEKEKEKIRCKRSQVDALQAPHRASSASFHVSRQAERTKRWQER
jgi:hypothetical protein